MDMMPNAEEPTDLESEPLNTSEAMIRKKTSLRHFTLLTCAPIIYVGGVIAALTDAFTEDMLVVERDIGRADQRRDSYEISGTQSDGTKFELSIPSESYDRKRGLSSVLSREFHWDFSREGQLRHLCPDKDTDRSKIVADLSRALLGTKPDERNIANTLYWVQDWVKYDKIEQASRRDFARSSVETLVEKRGDCEDSAILFYELLMESGVDLLFVRVVFEKSAHILVAVPGEFEGSYIEVEQKRYYLAETTTFCVIGEPLFDYNSAQECYYIRLQDNSYHEIEPALIELY